MNRNWKLLVLAIGALLIFGFVYLTSQLSISTCTSPEQCLSSKTAGLKLEREFVGQKAFDVIRTSHMGKVRTPKDVAIGYYEEGLTVWISQYDSNYIASQEAKRMVKAVGTYAGGFGKLKQQIVDGQTIYRTSYEGSFHYFWSKKHFVFYVVPGPLDDSNIKQLIRDINSRL